jgi:hypothetical protein
VSTTAKPSYAMSTHRGESVSRCSNTEPLDTSASEREGNRGRGVIGNVQSLVDGPGVKCSHPVTIVLDGTTRVCIVKGLRAYRSEERQEGLSEVVDRLRRQWGRHFVTAIILSDNSGDQQGSQQRQIFAREHHAVNGVSESKGLLEHAQRGTGPKLTRKNLLEQPLLRAQTKRTKRKAFSSSLYTEPTPLKHGHYQP